MKVTIETCDNGLLVYNQPEGAEIGMQKMVYQENDICDAKHIANAFYEALEMLGEYRSKHEQHRVEIKCTCEQVTLDEDLERT